MTPTNSAKSRKPALLKAGFSLVEVMIGATILTVVGVGTLSGLLQAQRMTQGSINEGTAMTVAQGYLEQIKNMQFSLLDQATINDLINQGAVDALFVSELPDDPEAGANSDISNIRQLDLNNTPDDATDDLNLELVLYVEDISDTAGGVGEARRIILRYEYTDNTNFGSRTVTNTLYTVRSDVPTF